MSTRKDLSEHQYHLAVAAAHGATVEQMQAAWNALGGKPPPQALDVVIVNAFAAKKTPLIEFLSSLGKMDDADVVLNVWARAVGAYNKPLMKQLQEHPAFAKHLQSSHGGKLLIACTEAGFEGLMKSSLESLISLNPPQQALDAALAHVATQAPDKSFRDGWDEAFALLVRAGADPFSRIEKRETQDIYLLLDPVAIFVAKEASRLRNNGAGYLRAMIQAHSADTVLSNGMPKRGFVGMWVGGGGDLDALVEALEYARKEGHDWRAADRYGAFSDALRLGCLDPGNALFAALAAGKQPPKDRVPSSRIARIVDQAFRVSMRGQVKGEGGLDDIFADMFSKKKDASQVDEAYANHRAFWARCAGTLAPLFEDPSAWSQACQRIQAALMRSKEPAKAEVDAVLSAIDLDCKTPTPTRPARKSRL